MHHFARRTVAVTLALAGSIPVLAGCGSDKDDTSAAATTTTAPASASAAQTHPSQTGAVPTETKIATQNGTIAVTGRIFVKYTEMGGPTGTLGQPTGNSVNGPNGGSCQEFAGGAVCASDPTGAHVVWGDIRAAWDVAGGINGRYGYPTTDEKDNPDGTKQSEFTGGTISWEDGQTTATPK